MIKEFKIVALVKIEGEKLFHILRAFNTLSSKGDQISLEETEGETITPRILSELLRAIHLGDFSEGGGGREILSEPPGRREHFSRFGNTP